MVRSVGLGEPNETSKQWANIVSLLAKTLLEGGEAEPVQVASPPGASSASEWDNFHLDSACGLGGRDFLGGAQMSR